MSRGIQYESLCNWKYRLTSELVLQSSIRAQYLRTEYVELKYDGTLTLRKGYAWNGASAPAPDIKTSMRATAGHDALYQLLSKGLIHQSLRLQADWDLRNWMIEDGTSEMVANTWYQAVRAFGWAYAAPSAKK